MATRLLQCERHGFAYRQTVGAIQGTIGSVEALEYADTEPDYCPGCREEEELTRNNFVPKKGRKKRGNTESNLYGWGASRN
jgi:hypothetical protein